jgi:hypothetical protein
MVEKREGGRRRGMGRICKDQTGGGDDGEGEGVGGHVWVTSLL